MGSPGGFPTFGASLYSKNGMKFSARDVEEISCPFCKLVLRKPMQLLSCGHRFCRTCLEVESISECPFDEEAIVPQKLFNGKACQREIESLESSCIMGMNGCTWRGPLLKLENHMKPCTFAIVTCERCSRTFPTLKMDAHNSRKCPNLATAYANPGDDSLVPSSHERNLQEITAPSLHPTMPSSLANTDGGADCQEKSVPLGTSLQSVHSDRGYGSLTEPAQSSINLTQNNKSQPTLEEKTEELREQDLEGGGSAEPVQEAVDMDDSVCQIQTLLSGPLQILEEWLKKVGNQQLAVVGSVESVREADGRCAVASDDSKLRQDIVDAKTTSGVFIWKIPDIRKRFRDAVEHRTPCLYSPPFYSSPHGYLMCIRILLNGDGSGSGTHLSVFVVLMRSEHDSDLRWPFTQPVTFTLVNQGLSSKKVSQIFYPESQRDQFPFQRPQSEMNEPSGLYRFVPQSVLCDVSFIQDGTLSIRCEVGMSELRI